MVRLTQCLTSAALLTGGAVGFRIKHRAQQRPTQGSPWLSPDRPLIIAHGNCPCLPEPSNSLQYFNYAHQLGVDAFEIDIQITSDDVLIAFHGKDYDHYSNASGSVRANTYEWARNNVDLSVRYPAYANESVPPQRLEDVLSPFANTHLLFNLEIKTAVEDASVVAEKVCEIVTRLGIAEKVLVASFETESVTAVRNACDVATSASESEGYTAIPLIYLHVDRLFWWKGGVSALQLPMSATVFDHTFSLTEKWLIDRIHWHGIPHHSIWVNDRESMAKLIDSGSDGLITDNIPLLRQVLREKGKELPPSGHAA